MEMKKQKTLVNQTLVLFLRPICGLESPCWPLSAMGPSIASRASHCLRALSLGVAPTNQRQQIPPHANSYTSPTITATHQQHKHNPIHIATSHQPSQQQTTNTKNTTPHHFSPTITVTKQQENQHPTQTAAGHQPPPQQSSNRNRRPTQTATSHKTNQQHNPFSTATICNDPTNLFTHLHRHNSPPHFRSSFLPFFPCLLSLPSSLVANSLCVPSSLMHGFAREGPVPVPGGFALSLMGFSSRGLVRVTLNP